MDLPVNLRKNGFKYTQVSRTENHAIYRQTVSEKLEYFEVFTIRIRPEKLILGKIIQSGEVFPNDEAFGISAWTFSTLEKAMQKYSLLIEPEREKK